MGSIKQMITNIKEDINEYTEEKKMQIKKVIDIILDKDITQSIDEKDYLISYEEKQLSYMISQLRILDRYEVFNKDIILKKLDREGFEEINDISIIKTAYVMACGKLLRNNDTISDDCLICLYLENDKYKLLKDELQNRELFTMGKPSFDEKYIENQKNKKEFMDILNQSEMASKIVYRINNLSLQVKNVQIRENKVTIYGDDDILEEIIYRKEGYPDLQLYQTEILAEYLLYNLDRRYELTNKNDIRLSDIEKGIRETW